jgi:glutathione S-transferase
MHSGFQDMRSRMPMNCQIEFTTVLFDVKVRQDIGRVLAIWRDCRERFGAEGPFLFGRFSIADAYFAPVAQRFVSYGVELPPVERRYVETIQSLPAMQEWLEAARAENDFFIDSEPYRATP